MPWTLKWCQTNSFEKDRIRIMKESAEKSMEFQYKSSKSHIFCECENRKKAKNSDVGIALGKK